MKKNLSGAATAELVAMLNRHHLGGGGDVRSFSANLGRGRTTFIEEGGRASAAANEMADAKSGALAAHIDSVLSPAERAVKYCRLNTAYQMLKNAGIDVD